MKKIIIAILVFLVLSTSVFSAEKANESATLVLDLDTERFLVGFSSTTGTITRFTDNKIILNEEVNASTLDTFSLSFDGPVYLYYKAVTKKNSNYKIQLSIVSPLRLNGSDDNNTIEYSLTANKVAGKWDGTDFTNITVPTPEGINTVDIGNIRADGKTNYLVTGFAELSITSQNNGTNIPVGTYKSNVKVSIVTT